MRFRSTLVAITVAVVSSLATWQWASAQTTQVVVPQPPVIDEGIKSGADIGFRLQYVNGNKAVGRLVVKVNGKWVAAEPSVTVYRPLSH